MPICFASNCAERDRPLPPGPIPRWPQQSFILRQMALYTWAAARLQQLFRMEVQRPLQSGQG
ncbi:MAG: hypothetical protein NTV57_13005 [Cyanobacteria bacterium]|nr:hypothetical protein [Cyanobacteriota bacterium]